jgi:hypothetical protein
MELSECRTTFIFEAYPAWASSTALSNISYTYLKEPQPIKKKKNLVSNLLKIN